MNEILEIEPEQYKIMAQDKVKEYSDELVSLQRKQAEWKNLRVQALESEYWFFDWILETLDSRVSKLQTQLFVWRNRLHPENNIATSYIDIESIKQIPIDHILKTDWIFSTEQRAKCVCPLHNEKTASFVWYKNTNSFHCFGCGKSGDVINLYQNLYSCDFKTALHDLQKM